MQYINQLVEELKWRLIPTKPSTREQMTQLNSLTAGRKLPQAYLEFMSVMGNGTEGGFMGGDSCYMNEIFDLQQGAIELLEENESKLSLTDEDFVFWMSQGCSFCFFNLTEGENPPVYFFNEDGKDRYVRIASCFTEFLMNRLHIFDESFAYYK